MSAGQIRIQEIIAQYLTTYQKLKGDASYAYLPDNILYEIREKFNQDDIIKNDSITGIHLSNPTISKNYLSWLQSSSSPETITKNFPKVNLDRFIYDGGARKVAYLGGIKYDTTFSCLFSIANGDRISPDSWNPVYFPFEGILETGDGGRHRLLAHVLYGKSEIFPAFMYIYENQKTSDRILHSSLLKLESFFSEIHQSFFVDWDQLEYSNKLPIQEQAILVKETASNLSPEDRRIIKGFYLSRTKDRQYEFENYFDRNRCTLQSFLRFLNEVKVIQGKPSLHKYILNNTPDSF